MVHVDFSLVVLAAPFLVAAAVTPIARSDSTTTLDISSTYTDFNSIFTSLRSAAKKKPKPLAAAASNDNVEPPVPDGYAYTLEEAGANSAPFYMGFVTLATYDVQACADACNAALPDSDGGYCQYFNIWQAVVNGTASQTVCAKYYVPANSTTATNTGDGTITVTLSRGYTRLSLLPDGTFESYSCPLPSPQGPTGCYTDSFGGWVGKSDPGGFYDATIQYFSLGGPVREPIIGHTSVLLGSVYGDTDRGTLTTVSPLATVPGETYVVGFHHRSRHQPQPGFPDSTPTLAIIWNGVYVDNIIGYYFNSNSKVTSFVWKGYSLVAQGNDTLSFYGGVFPSGIDLDNVFLFKA